MCKENGMNDYFQYKQEKLYGKKEERKDAVEFQRQETKNFTIKKNPR